MRKIIFALFLFSLIFTALLTSFSFAQGFNNAYLRLANQSANSALSGTVCAQPSSSGAGVESKVVVIFPSNFTISQNTSNWTTNTTNLPAGSTAWPGIGSAATSVSGKGVTFASSDLTANVVYCFNFAGTSSTTGSAGNNQSGSIATQKSNGQTIDLTAYAVSITNSNKINITASVDPRISDLQANLSSVTSGTEYNQNTTITYKLTYGSYLSSVFPIKYEVTWSQGTIQGNSLPSLDIVDYVTDSAENAYGSIPAVVDLVNNKIDWTFSSFPPNTYDKTLTFKLKTNSSYTGNLPVNFTVIARAIANTTVTADSNVNQKYIYISQSNPTGTPTPTKGPKTATPTPSPTPTPVPVQNLSFGPINIQSISQEKASVSVSTSKDSKMTISYGTSPTSLNKNITTNAYVKNQIFDLPTLTASTDYFLRVLASDINKNTISSDIFKFTTASAPPVAIDPATIIVTSQNNVIFDTSTNTSLSEQTKTTSQNPQTQKVIVIPQSTNFQFKFSFKQLQSVQKVKIIFRKISQSKNIKVLGINNFSDEAEAASNNVTLLEVKPGEYTATIKSQNQPGTYDLSLSYLDENGNLVEQKITEINVTNPFTVIGSDGDRPLEGVRVFLYIYNDSSRTFVPLSSSQLNIDNPSFTDNNGVDNLVLPTGKYRVNLTNLGYKEKNAEFSISDTEQSNYPIVRLYIEKFSIISFLKYYYIGFNDVLVANAKIFITNLEDSLRFFNLVSGAILAALIILCFYAFSKRHSVPFSKLYSYFYYLLDKKSRNEKYVHGVVYDENEKPIIGANVYLSNKDSEEIIDNTKTNQNGEFYFKKGKAEYLIMATKVGFHPTKLLPYSEKTNLKFKINLLKADFTHDSFDRAKGFVETVFGMSFELLLLTSFMFELLFINTFGFIKTAPFLALSVFNLALWLLHLSHQKSLRA